MDAEAAVAVAAAVAAVETVGVTAAVEAVSAEGESVEKLRQDLTAELMSHIRLSMDEVEVEAEEEAAEESAAGLSIDEVEVEAVEQVQAAESQVGEAVGDGVTGFRSLAARVESSRAFPPTQAARGWPCPDC